MIVLSNNFISDRDYNFLHHLKIENGFWRFVNSDERSSEAIKYDKFVQEVFKTYLHSFNPKTSILSRLSIRDILLPHSQRKHILHIDIKSYYSSIDKGSVVSYVTNHGILSGDSLLCFEGFYFDRSIGLRRGLGASPAISEIVGLKIDNISRKVIHETGNLTNTCYGRYYDDLLFSSDDIEPLRLIEKRLNDELKTMGFSFNPNKTKLVASSGSKILGLRITNNKNVTVPKQIKRYLRPRIHNAQTLYSICEDTEWQDIDIIGATREQLSCVIGTTEYIIKNTPTVNPKYSKLKNQFTSMLQNLECNYSKLIEDSLFLD